MAAGMAKFDLLSNELVLRWDDASGNLFVVHPNARRFPHPLVQIRLETLQGMDFPTASHFIGETLIFLIPGLREQFVDGGDESERGTTDEQP